MTGSRLIILSSPHAQMGALYELHRRYYGQTDAGVLVWQASAPTMNPLLTADYLERMHETTLRRIAARCSGSSETTSRRSSPARQPTHALSTGVANSRPREGRSTSRSPIHRAVRGIRSPSASCIGVAWTGVSPEWTAVHVQRAVTLGLGPGETKRIAKLKGVKSSAGDRWLPISPPVAMLLEKWRLQCPATDLDLILPSATGGILHPRTLYDALKRAQAATGVRPLDLKAFRHTFATALVERGEADTQIARLMGHAGTTVTRRIYAHAFVRPEGSQVAKDFAAAIFHGGASTTTTSKT